MSAKPDPYYDDAKEAVAMPQVLRELGQAEKQLDNTSEMIAQLEVRLESVLRPKGEINSGASHPEPIRVPLANRIDTLRRIAATQTAHLNNILERLEL